MSNLILALLGWIVVGWLPGWLLLARRPWVARRLTAVVAAPLVSMGLLLLSATFDRLVGIRVGPATTWVPVLLVAALSLWRRPAAPQMHVGRPIRLHVTVLTLLVVVLLGIWLLATHAGSLYPPNDDGAHHGLFAYQILHLATFDPSRVAVGDVLAGEPHWTYYPLGLHLVSALVSGLTGAPVAVTLNIQVIMAAAVVLPLGAYELARRVVPQVPTAALAAAVVSAAFPEFPYYVSYWGGLPFIVGVCSLAAAAALCGDLLDEAVLWAGLLIGLVLVGYFGLHQSEFLALVVLVPLVRLPELIRRRPGPLLRLVAVSGAVLTAFVVPQLGMLISRSGDLSSLAPLPRLPLPSALAKAAGYFLTPAGPQTAGIVPQSAGAQLAAVLAGVLVVAGIGYAFARKVARRWVVALGFVLVWTGSVGLHVPIVTSASFAWYSRWDRIVILEVVLLPLIAGLGVALLWQAASRIDARALRLTGRTAAVLALLVVAGSGLWGSRQVVDFAFSRASVVGPQTQTAFAWLAAHVRPGDRVLNDSVDGSGWLWAGSQVPPLFAMAPHALPGWGDRLTLLARAGQVGVDPQVTAIARQWQLEYALVGSDTFPWRRRTITAAELIASPGWKLAFRSGDAYVFERVAQ